MFYTVFTWATFLVFTGEISSTVLDEHKCSKFEYEYKILERIIFLENKNVELEKQQVVLSRKNEELTEVVKEQRLEMERLNEEQNQGREKLQSAMLAADNVLERKQSGLDEAHKANKEQLTNQERKHDEDLDKIKSELKRIENATTSGVYQNISFTAKMHASRSYSSGQTLVFEKVENNDGNAYNPSTGVFTAPLTGKYLLTTTITVNGGNFASVFLMKNTNDIGRVYPDKDQDSGDYGTSSVTAVVNLNKEDTVFVRLNHQRRSGSIYNLSYTSFAGVLLKSMY